MTRFLPTTAQALWIAILLLLADTSTVRAQVITVGPNVQISDGREGYSYSEVRIAADPFNPLHLVACSMQSFNRDAESGTVAFVSDDRGANWRRTLELVNGGADEECEFGNHGDVYFLADGFEDTTDLSTIRDYVYWSGDGGHSWQERPPLPFIDREQMAVDRTDGNDRDTLYIVGASLGEVSPMTGAVALSKSSTIYRSRDHGKFFNVTQVLHYDPKPSYPPSGVFHTHPVVLSDGAVVFLTHRHHREPTQRESTFTVYAGRHTSLGLSFSRVSVTPAPLSGVIPPDLAAARDGVFKDRLYAVYCGATVPERQTPYLVTSDTRGKTWSVPLAIGPSLGPCEYPEVAVNMFGVVGVSWYSGKPDHKYTLSSDGIEERLKFNARTDLDVRFTASLDGGKTVLPSVIINPIRDPKHLKIAPYIQFLFSSGKFVWDFMTPASLGETAGITADADGSFHPDWIDYRTGTGQVWTTRIDVSGAVASVKTDIVEAAVTELPANETTPPHGAGETPSENISEAANTAPQASTNDVTASYKAHMLKLTYDKKSGTFEADIQLEGPRDQLGRGVYLQAELGPNSMGNATFLNADNGLQSTGARWLFTGSAMVSATTNGKGKSQIRRIRVRVLPVNVSEELGAEFCLRVLVRER